MLTFVIGMLIGTFLGIFLMACLISGKHADRGFERDDE